MNENNYKKELVNNPGKVSSAVWKHFGFWKIVDQDGVKINKDKAVCKVCNAELNYHTNTTNLANHLRSKHADLEQRPVTKQLSLQSAFQKVQKLPFNSVRSAEITNAIGKYIVKDMCPLSTVESEGFRGLVDVLEPRYQVPSRKYISETLLPKMFNATKAELEANIKQASHVCLTHDLWTSINTESYGTVTGHFIDEKWKLQSVVLNTQKFEGSHTGEAISQDLERVRNEWGLGLPTIVTDSAANEILAIRMLDWPHLSCMGHNINLAVRAALDIPEASKLVARGRNLVSFFHRSPLATEILLRKQTVLPEAAQGHKLIQDVATRWNSTLDMLVRVLEQTAALHCALADPAIKKGKGVAQANLFDFREQATAEALVALLKPMKDATVLLCQDERPTLPLVWPTLIKIKGMLAAQDDDSLVISKMKVKMVENLLKRNTSDNAKRYMGLGCILDPRLKDLHFLSADERAKAQDDMIREAVEIKTENLQGVESSEATNQGTQGQSTEDTENRVPAQLIKSEPVDDPPTKRVKKELTLDFLDDVICMGEEPGIRVEEAPIDVATAEVTRYLAEPKLERNSDPLEWWKQRHTAYPILSKLAKKYLCVVASSTPSERVFSMAGNLISKRRARLSADKVDMMIFLNKNTKK